MLADTAPAASAPEPILSNNPLLSVLGFMEALTNHCSDGRVVCSRKATVGCGTLKFLLLNPASHFSSIVKEARYPRFLSEVALPLNRDTACPRLLSVTQDQNLRVLK